MRQYVLFLFFSLSPFLIRTKPRILGDLVSLDPSPFLVTHARKSGSLLRLTRVLLRIVALKRVYNHFLSLVFSFI